MNIDPKLVESVANAIYEATPGVRSYESLSAFKRAAIEAEARAAIAVVDQRLTGIFTAFRERCSDKADYFSYAAAKTIRSLPLPEVRMMESAST
jgi:hypothetical protein